MEWADEGMLLSVRRHGEGSAIIDVFTQNHGRHTGIVRGGGSRKSAAMLQPGTQLALNWRARLEDHLGSFNVEPKTSRVNEILKSRVSLAGFGAISALLSACLPERESQIALYGQTMDLVDNFGAQCWSAKYALWELALLNQTGFGIDLSKCVVTGAAQGLAFVSPKSGRAVSREAAKGWESKLLKLPQFLLSAQAESPSSSEILLALQLSEHFLLHGIMAASNRQELPQARSRFIAVLRKLS